MDFDDKFLDLDFSKQPEFIFGAKEPKGLGRFSAYEDAVPVLSDADIDAAIEAMDAAGGGADRLVTRIYDQDGEGSCVANACSQSNEIVQGLQFGKDAVVHLSAMSLYKRIASGPNSGADVSDGLDAMIAGGVLPLDNPENRAKFGDKVMANIGWRNRYPDGWEAVAKNYRVVEAHVVRSVEGLMTALCNQHPVVVGRQGHSICYVRPFGSGRNRKVYYANSWSLNWGQALGDFKSGFGVDSQSTVRDASSWAFAVRSVTVPRKAA